MAVYFNDLTIVKDDPQQNCRLLPEFWDVMVKLQKCTGGKEKHVYANKGVEPLWEAVFASGNPELMMKYGTYFKNQYHDDEVCALMTKADEHTGGEAEYRMSVEGGESFECKMLGWAHHERSVTLGLSSSPFWNQLVYPVERTTLDDDEPTVVEAVCITGASQIETKRVQGWIAAQQDFADVVLPEACPLDPSEKHIKVQMHDGRDVMMSFAEKLCRDPLVQGVIDNIAFDSTTNRFILKCYDDGVIDLRMHWTDKGFGLKIQTMARGLPQTQLVADVLREKYDRKS